MALAGSRFGGYGTAALMSALEVSETLTALNLDGMGNAPRRRPA
jgi:hypothetical protein